MSVEDVAAEGIWQVDPFRIGDPNVWTGTDDQGAYIAMALNAITALKAAGYAVVDAERFRIARKGFIDLTEAWAELRMDTEKDQALHDRLVATSRVSAALLPEVTP